MSRSWKMSALVVVLCLGVLMSGCYGPFNATRRLHHWNGSVDGKWGNEGVFLVCVILPVYGLFALGDAIIFNSIEFWGGSNPIDPPMAKSDVSSELDKVAALYGLPPEVVVTTAPGTVVR